MNSLETQTPNWPKISELQKMNLEALRAEYQKVFGKNTQSRNRKQLFEQIAKKLQVGEQPADTDAGSTRPESSGKSTKSVLTAKFEPRRKQLERHRPSRKAVAPRTRKTLPAGTADPRLPRVGTTITKKYKGRTINVRVLEKGFSYEGKPYRSLSAVAKKVTGAIWNGFLFFGLTERPGK